MFVGAVYDRAVFIESGEYARSSTSPTGDSPLLGQAPETGGVCSIKKKREATLINAARYRACASRAPQMGGPSGTDVSVIAVWIVSSTASRLLKRTLFKP
jgi:hypothetical protein